MTIHGCIPTHMEALTAKLLEMGVRVTEKRRLHPCPSAGRTAGGKCQNPGLSGFPTDLQQPMTALSVHGARHLHRMRNHLRAALKHLDELRRMGAHIKLVDRTVLIEGVRELYGAPVTVTDLRAGAALVVAA